MEEIQDISKSEFIQDIKHWKEHKVTKLILDLFKERARTQSEMLIQNSYLTQNDAALCCFKALGYLQALDEFFNIENELREMINNDL